MELIVFGFSWLIVPIALYLLSGIKVAQEYQRAVVFFLGCYSEIKGPGLYWIPTGFKRQRMVDIRIETVDVERQETITKDSVTIKVNAVLWYKIIDPAKAVISVANYEEAVYQVALTSLRNIIGQHQLDEVLKDRTSINQTLQQIVDQTTSPWGIKVEMVEMKDVEIPTSMQRAMAREAEAQREKRARIIKAQAELDSSEKLAKAAQFIQANPAVLELRRMQMITEVGAENNTTTIITLPSDLITMSSSLNSLLQNKLLHETPPPNPPQS